MSNPEYVICLNCETPVYEVEFKGEQVATAFCAQCGNDDPMEFMTESDLEEQRD